MAGRRHDAVPAMLQHGAGCPAADRGTTRPKRLDPRARDLADGVPPGDDPDPAIMREAGGQNGDAPGP